MEHVLLRCGVYVEERRKLCSVLEEDCVGWGEMVEGEKLVVLLGEGGLGCLLFYVLFWRRGRGGLELAGFGDFNCDCVLVSLFFSVYNDGIVCSCGFNYYKA